MIKLTKLNGEIFVVNCGQIEIIEAIPESKVVLQNKTYFLVKESPEDIIRLVIEFYSMVETFHKHVIELRE